MADSLFIVPIQIWVYGMIVNAAGSLWQFNRSMLLAGLMVQAFNQWLVDELFGPAISDFVLLSEGLMPAVFTLAVFVLALGYLIAPFFKVRVVSFGKALGWLLFALLFYQAGPGLYVEGEQLRRGMSTEFYGQVLSQATSAPTTTGPLAVLSSIASGPDDAMGALDNQFGAFIPSDIYVDGLDIAMAYTLSTGDDVVLALAPLPEDFQDEYFDPASGPLFYLTMDAQSRTDSINAGLTGVSRQVLGSMVVVFGLFEQTIYLALSTAAGILFISMSFAILLAFFERTEMIARTLIDMWLELFILSAIIAILQAFMVGLVTVGARTLNPTLTLGSAVLGTIVMAVLLLKAVGAIWEALNRMFRAMSETVGGGLMTPAEAAMNAAGGAAGLALTVATAGAGAVVAGAAGASAAQIAGSALSGMDTLYSASALGTFVLPDESKLKQSAQGFYEGALSNRLMGPVGGLMLGDHSERPPAPQPVQATVPTAGNTIQTAQPQTDIRLDSADLTGLRDAVSTAMTQAMQSMPQGGYASQDAALQAVRGALAGIRLADSPSGFAAGHPALGDYMGNRSDLIATRLMKAGNRPATVEVTLPATSGRTEAPPTEREA